MIEFFYDIVLSDVEKTRIRGLKEGILTPAELSKIMFECFSDYKETIQQLETLSEHYVPRIEPDNALLSINDSEIVTRELTTVNDDLVINNSALTYDNESSPFVSLNNVDSLQDPICSGLDAVTRLDPLTYEDESSTACAVNVSLRDPPMRLRRSGLAPVANLAMERAAVLPIQTPYYGYEPNKMSVFPIQSYNPNEIGAALYE
jgi:hypothetical protein